MKPHHGIWIAGVAAAIALPFVHREPYHLHILVLILIWSFAYTSWSIMGRFGLVSLGHGGFRGAGRRGGLSLLSLPHYRSLFRAGDAGAVRHRASGHHRHARLYWRLARLYAGPHHRQPLAGAAVRRQDNV